MDHLSGAYLVTQPFVNAADSDLFEKLSAVALTASPVRAQRRSVALATLVLTAHTR